MSWTRASLIGVAGTSPATTATDSIVKQPDARLPSDMRHRPPFLVRPGAAGRLLPSDPVRACGTTGRKAAPAAPACFQHAGNPYADASAHGVTSLERSLRLRSAREWVFRLAECPQASSLPLTSPGSCDTGERSDAVLRTAMRPDTHLDRSPVLPASVPSGPYPWRRKTGIVANHRIPLRDRKTVRTRPHIGAGQGQEYS